MQFVQLLLRKLHFLNASRTESRSASFLRRSPEIRDSRGFGLIEVIVVVAIISIVALGIATMMQDMFSQQQRAAQKGTLNSTRARLLETLQSPTGWAATVAHTSNDSALACMRVGNTCAHGTTGAFNIVDSTNTVIYPSATATAGFRPDGSNCNTFSAGTPDPTCPFRWSFVWTASCPSGSGTCPAPDVHIVGTFAYAPGSTAGFGAGFNPNTYSIDFRRGADVVANNPVRFWYQRNDNTGELGGCNAGWTTRLLNSVHNPNLIGRNPAHTPTSCTSCATGPVANNFALPAGSYNCRALVPGFKNGGNRIRIMRNGSTVPEAESGIALASVETGGAVVNTLEFTLRVNADSSFRVEHTCTSSPAAATWGNQNPNFAKGVPVPDPTTGTYVNVTFTSVSCIQTGG